VSGKRIMAGQPNGRPASSGPRPFVGGFRATPCACDAPNELKARTAFQAGGAMAPNRRLSPGSAPMGLQGAKPGQVEIVEAALRYIRRAGLGNSDVTTA